MGGDTVAIVGAGGSSNGAAELSRGGSAGFDAASVVGTLATAGLRGSPKSSGPVSTTGSGTADDDELYATDGNGVTIAETAAAVRSGSELGESA
jgi:hypothetical protein